MRNLVKRLVSLEAKLPKPATAEPISAEELTRLVFFMLLHNVLSFDEAGQVVCRSTFGGEDYGWLADVVNAEIADNPDLLPIFPLWPDEAAQALTALDAGHMIIKEVCYGSGRLAYKQLGRAWHGPSLGDLPYTVDRAIKVLNAQLAEPFDLSVTCVRELLELGATQ